MSRQYFIIRVFGPGLDGGVRAALSVADLAKVVESTVGILV